MADVELRVKVGRGGSNAGYGGNGRDYGNNVSETLLRCPFTLKSLTRHVVQLFDSSRTLTDDRRISKSSRQQYDNCLLTIPLSLSQRLIACLEPYSGVLCLGDQQRGNRIAATQL